jgi:catechol 2,3-dioxygenase
MIPDGAKIQSIDLRVRDLETSQSFYSGKLGFLEIERRGYVSFLSADGKHPYIIKLTEDKDAPVRMKGTAGLYHVAFLFPNRGELARVFLRLFKSNVKFQGFSDHLVSEAIYLADPDGNGIELYVDKPKANWEWRNGEVVMDSLPLDLSLITNELKDREVMNGIHPETEIGHIHLNVTDLNKTEEFLNEYIGFSVSNYSYPGARFFSAGGYHHHVGSNTWNTNRKLIKNENSLGMTSFSIRLNDNNYIDQIKEKLTGSEYRFINEKDSEISLYDHDGNLMKLIS